MMGNIRYCSLLIVVIVLCLVSIYTSYLQYNIALLNLIHQEEPFEKFYQLDHESTKHKENANTLHKTDFKNSSRCHNSTTSIRSQNSFSSFKHSSTLENERKIWISMGLCFSKNTELYGKRNYPYAQVTPLAIILWYHFFPNINVIIYLVYDKNEIEDRKRLYEEQLKQTKAEIRWVKSDDINCVSKSQLIRMWAFQEPMIKDDDIIINVDVNLFVATSKILDPIFNNPDLKVWNFQWHRSAFVNTSIGETFNQNLMSAKSKVWRLIVEPNKDEKLNQEWLSERIKEIGLARAKQNDKWYYDQWITTYGILKNKLCTVPKSSGLWNVPGLVERNLYNPQFNDSETCWHGKNYHDCNQINRIIPFGCKWWHFYPSQSFKEHVQKFNELTNNEYKLNFGDIFTHENWNKLHPR